MLSPFIPGCWSGRIVTNPFLLGGIATGISKCLRLRLKVNGEIKAAPFRDCRNSAARHRPQPGSAPSLHLRYPFPAIC